MEPRPVQRHERLHARVAVVIEDSNALGNLGEAVGANLKKWRWIVPLGCSSWAFVTEPVTSTHLSLNHIVDLATGTPQYVLYAFVAASLIAKMRNSWSRPDARHAKR